MPVWHLLAAILLVSPMGIMRAVYSAEVSYLHTRSCIIAAAVAVGPRPTLWCAGMSTWRLACYT
jgi:hypothetical protein